MEHINFVHQLIPTIPSNNHSKKIILQEILDSTPNPNTNKCNRLKKAIMSCSSMHDDMCRKCTPMDLVVHGKCPDWVFDMLLVHPKVDPNIFACNGNPLVYLCTYRKHSAPCEPYHKIRTLLKLGMFSKSVDELGDDILTMILKAWIQLPKSYHNLPYFEHQSLRGHCMTIISILFEDPYIWIHSYKSAFNLVFNQIVAYGSQLQFTSYVERWKRQRTKLKVLVLCIWKYGPMRVLPRDIIKIIIQLVFYGEQRIGNIWY